MRKFVTISILGIVLLTSIKLGICQTRVVDISQIKGQENLNILPDVDGKVLIMEDFVQKLTEQGLFTPISLYPGWPLTYNGSSTRGGIYCNLDADDDLEIVYNTGLQTYAWNIDGTVVTGWPVGLSMYPDGAPAFGDIDGDGEGEIVISTRTPGTGNSGQLYAFEKDGSTVTGFPVTMSGGATKTPVLADLNGDGSYEIVVEERAYPNGYIGVYNGDGTLFPSFPVEMGEIPGSAAAVGDITGDNIPEIVAESYYNVFAYDNAGNLLSGFPYSPGTDRVFSYSSPVLADLDGDGYREILVGDHSSVIGNGAVHAIRYNGAALEGWPNFVGNWIYGPPAVGDINGDGNLDVAVGDQVLSGSPSDTVYVWDNTGNLLPGWPSPPMNAIHNQIMLADIDGDDEVELVWDDNTGDNVYIGYNHDGTVMSGWPLSLSGSSFFMNPFVTDINNDGILDMSGASIILSSNELNFYLWDLDVSVNPAKSPLTILQYNVRHDGTVVNTSLLSAGFIASPIELCEGGQVQFTDQSTGGATSWDWTFEGGDPATSTDQNPLVTYENAGDYNVGLIISDGSSSDEILLEDYIHVAYDAVIPDQPTGPANFSTDTSNFTYYETWAPNADEYIWELTPEDMGVILAGVTVTQLKIYWSQDDNYMAQLKVKAVNVCGESEFSEPLDIYVNWTIGVDEHRSQPYSISPNPNDGAFTLQFDPESEVRSVDILNAEGRLEKTYTVENSLLSIRDLNSGLYFLKIEMKDKTRFEKVIVK